MGTSSNLPNSISSGFENLSEDIISNFKIYNQNL